MTTPYPGNADWPTDWGPAYLAGQFVDLNGVPRSGAQCWLLCSVPAIETVSGVTVLGRDTVSVVLDDDGRLTLAVPAVDDPDIDVVGLFYVFIDPDGGAHRIRPAGGQLLNVESGISMAIPTSTPAVLGAGAPAASAAGVPGQAYIDTATGDVYVFGGVPPTASLYVGSGAPTTSAGVPSGAEYLDQPTGDIYINS